MPEGKISSPPSSSDLSLVLTRFFDAPCSRVFEAWTKRNFSINGAPHMASRFLIQKVIFVRAASGIA